MMSSDESMSSPAGSARPLTGRQGRKESALQESWNRLSAAFAKRIRLWRRRYAVSHQQRRLVRLCLAVIALITFKVLLLDSKPASAPGEIEHPALLERLALNAPILGQSSLDARKYDFLQSRIGRDERPDLFIGDIKAGLTDFWNRFQLPFATSADTTHLDDQVVKSVVDDLMSFNGWAAASCSSLIRPFGSHRRSHTDEFTDLSSKGQLYYFALVVHSADHFVIDQLAIIIQMARRLGPNNVFVSLLDYASTDATPFLCDLTEMVLILLGIPFRIRRIPPMTSDPAAAYYPLEEAHTRNIALEPLMELFHRRHVRFSRVIWLKGFACPTDILESLRLSNQNKAAMTCSMDWKEHNKFFIYNDRWRTRDLDGNLFRGSKSTAAPAEAPPREIEAAKRYAAHEPFQVFCCESGVHIVDPAQSYYQGLKYRSSIDYGVFNISDTTDGTSPRWSEGPCMDSTQMHFCRDLWLMSARDTVERVGVKAKEAERRGLPRKLSAEWESLLKSVKPLKVDPSQAGASDTAEGWTGDLGLDDEDEDGGEAGQAVTTDGAKAQAMAAADAAGAALPDDQQEPAQDQPHDAKEAAAKWQALDPEHAQDQEQQVNALPLAQDDMPEEPQDQAANVEAGGAVQPEDLAQGGQPLPLAQHAEEAGGAKEEVPGAAAGAAEQALEGEAAAAQAEPPVQGQLKKRAIEDEDQSESSRSTAKRGLPNAEFDAARIMVNPRCITTYAGVSHTQLAIDLFGQSDDENDEMTIGKGPAVGSQFQLKDDEWRSAPETFVCQEMRTTGGRVAPKQQRRTGFYIAKALQEGWHPSNNRRK